MTLGPDEIVNYELRQGLRGYATEQVDELLDRIADQVERTQQEMDELRRRLRDTEARLAAALENEGTLQRRLVSAQEAGQRAMADAREQADELRAAVEREALEQLERARADALQIVETAQAEARSELSAAREQRAAVEQRIEALRELEQRHRRRLEHHLRTHLEQLDALATSPAPGPPPDGGEDAAPEPTLRVRVHDVERGSGSAGAPTWSRPPEDDGDR